MGLLPESRLEAGLNAALQRIAELERKVVRLEKVGHWHGDVTLEEFVRETDADVDARYAETDARLANADAKVRETGAKLWDGTIKALGDLDRRLARLERRDNLSRMREPTAEECGEAKPKPRGRRKSS